MIKNIEDYWNFIQSIHNQGNEEFYYELEKHSTWTVLRDKAREILIKMDNGTWQIQVEKDVKKNLLGQIISTSTHVHLFNGAGVEVESSSID